MRISAGVVVDTGISRGRLTIVDVRTLAEGTGGDRTELATLSGTVRLRLT